MYVGIDWQIIREHMDKTPWRDTDNRTAQITSLMRSVLIGDIRQLQPSGKHYTPWAESGVTEEEIEKDWEWWITAENQASWHNLVIGVNGESPEVHAYEYF